MSVEAEEKKKKRRNCIIGSEIVIKGWLDVDEYRTVLLLFSFYVLVTSLRFLPNTFVAAQEYDS